MPYLQSSLPPSLLNLVLQHSSMASSKTLTLSLLTLSLISHTFSQHPTPKPTALVLPITKQPSSLQYTTTLTQSSPPSPLTLVIDLSAPLLWLSCGSSTHPNSSTFKRVECHSPHCPLLPPHSNKNCSKNRSCIIFSKNKFTKRVSAGELGEDILSLQSTNGLYPTSKVSVRRFPFLCLAQESQSLGLASGAKGVAGLGHDQLGLPAQLADAFNFSRKFAVCLSPATDAAGVLFFGDGPYAFSPGIDVSKLLIFTPLIRKRSTYSSEYFIEVKSVRVNEKTLPLKSTVLAMISTVNRYGILETNLYKYLARAFIEAMNATRVAPVPPFDICFGTPSGNGGGPMWPVVPVLDLVLHNKEVYWRIIESNSMVMVRNDTTCLGFLDGGPNPGASIILGGHQLEDNLLQFDLVSSMIGFTSSLFLRETDCASFPWH